MYKPKQPDGEVFAKVTAAALPTPKARPGAYVTITHLGLNYPGRVLWLELDTYLQWSAHIEYAETGTLKRGTFNEDEFELEVRR